MSKIGTFKKTDAGFLGSIRTLQIKANEVKFVENPATGEKAPDFKILCDGAEIGAAWQQTSKTAGTLYYSVKLDDVSFAHPIWANLVQADDHWDLIWSR